MATETEKILAVCRNAIESLQVFSEITALAANSACQVCWTNSWAPCPPETPDAVRLESSYVVCQMCQSQAALIAERERVVALEAALQGILDIGKRDMTNPKYDSYFDSAKTTLADSRQRERR